MTENQQTPLQRCLKRLPPHHPHQLQRWRLTHLTKSEMLLNQRFRLFRRSILTLHLGRPEEKTSIQRPDNRSEPLVRVLAKIRILVRIIDQSLDIHEPYDLTFLVDFRRGLETFPLGSESVVEASSEFPDYGIVFGDVCFFVEFFPLEVSAGFWRSILVGN